MGTVGVRVRVVLLGAPWSGPQARCGSGVAPPVPHPFPSDEESRDAWPLAFHYLRHAAARASVTLSTNLRDSRMRRDIGDFRFRGCGKSSAIAPLRFLCVCVGDEWLMPDARRRRAGLDGAARQGGMSGGVAAMLVSGGVATDVAI